MRDQSNDKMARYQQQLKEMQRQLDAAQEKIQVYESHRTTKKSQGVKLAPLGASPMLTKEDSEPGIHTILLFILISCSKIK